MRIRLATDFDLFGRFYIFRGSLPPQHIRNLVLKKFNSTKGSSYKTVQGNKINELHGLIVAVTVSINCLNCRLANSVEQIANQFYANTIL